jgi:hypothetical protein
MPVATDSGAMSPNLMVTREPVGPAVDKSDTVGTKAVSDGVIIIIVAWSVLFALAYSLRAHNI